MPLSPDHSASNLYCGEDAGSMVSWDEDTWISNPFPTIVFPNEDDDRWISRLVNSELHYFPQSDYLQRLRDRSIDPTARQDAVNWMLKVHAYHGFKPVTASLSVNYFDRFLSSHTLRQSNGWPLQLLSVTCLSLAAKIEEPNVPLLLDLQILESRFVFEPRTIQRMELLVLSNLQWRMSSVTPFDFLDYFVAKIPCFDSRYDLLNRVSSRVSDLILRTSQVIDFLDYSPSTIAAAAVLFIAGKNVMFPAGDDRKMDTFYERVNKEMVRSCHQLMEQYLIDACPSAARLRHVRLESAPPQSPVGVLDAAACGSCDTQKSGSDNPEPNEAEPPNKRRKSAPSDVHQI